jgi:hypothetical protein
VFRPALIEIPDNRVHELHHHQQGR